MDAANIIIRDFNPEQDESLIYPTWRNSYYTLVKAPDKAPDIWFKHKSGEIKKILSIGQVKIACLKDSPEVIIGYSVSTGTHLDYIYVKRDYRNCGIGRLVMPKIVETVTKDITKIGKFLADKKKLIIKGESNGRNTDPIETQNEDQIRTSP